MRLKYLNYEIRHSMSNFLFLSELDPQILKLDPQIGIIERLNILTRKMLLESVMYIFLCPDRIKVVTKTSKNTIARCSL